MNRFRVAALGPQRDHLVDCLSNGAFEVFVFNQRFDPNDHRPICFGDRDTDAVADRKIRSLTGYTIASERSVVDNRMRNQFFVSVFHRHRGASQIRNDTFDCLHRGFPTAFRRAIGVNGGAISFGFIKFGQL